ncbi:MAG TPA: DUF1631 family protein [Xanthomonadaceae bacterium]|nr:DUF1631 family protein [Xanthomonadaceae bacterium]
MSFPQTAPDAPQTLATAALPRRVRRALEHLLATASDELDRHLGDMLADFEQQLFRLSEQASGPVADSVHLQTLRSLRLSRADLVPRVVAGIETSLARLGRSAPAAPGQAPGRLQAQRLSLVDDQELDEETLLRNIAVRQESRASLTLHLLGQRFGVLAGAPAFDAERLPLGPRALCNVMRDAAQGLQLSQDARLLLYRTFDRRVMAHYPPLAEMFNLSLVGDGILPSLTYVPLRIRPPAAAEAAAAAASSAPGSKASGRRRAAERHGHDGPRPHTGWFGERDATRSQEDESAAFELLRHLLSGRRDLLGKLRPDSHGSAREQLPTQDVVGALARLQSNAPQGAPRNLPDIRHALLAQARQQLGHGASLNREDNDTFELLGMLYDQIEREMRTDSPAAPLLRELQVPLLRVALQDRAFFVREQHPARELLNAVAESGARWLDQDDLDPQVLEPLQRAVRNVVENYDGDPAVFEASNRELQQQLQTLARKAELAERRHIEAARGKEKLEIAKRQAGAAIAGIVGDRRLPRFVRALLNEAWVDVLTLTLLRQGENSQEWRQLLDITRQIAECCGPDSPIADPNLAPSIEAALSQVGYHLEEAAAIARRLTSAADDDEDGASRTELALRLKSRARLGEDSAERKPELPPRTPEEQARYEQLRVLPYGTWIEFTTNQQGDVVRRRLSWYSPITDNALFVNQRGRRVGEQSLDSVARLMAHGQARIVTAERGRLIDRAWQATLNALRSFAGRAARDAEDEA